MKIRWCLLILKDINPSDFDKFDFFKIELGWYIDQCEFEKTFESKNEGFTKRHSKSILLGRKMKLKIKESFFTE